MSDLIHKTCTPCNADTPPLTNEQQQDLLTQLDSDWRINEGPRLEKTFSFPNFVDALAFTNRVGEIAESIQHHPEIQLGWGKVTLTIWTHSIGGLSEVDFILAARADSVR